MNARNDWGTPLHEAAFFGHTAIAELLLARGADREAVTCRGETALGLAETRGHAAIAELLRSQ